MINLKLPYKVKASVKQKITEMSRVNYVWYLCLEFDNTNSFKGLFIRAPKISKLGKGIKILATYKKQPVMITNGRHFATTFHPEIGDDYRIHKHIMGKINE